MLLFNLAFVCLFADSLVSANGLGSTETQYYAHDHSDFATMTADSFKIYPTTDASNGRRLDEAREISVELDVNGEHMEYTLQEADCPVNKDTTVYRNGGDKGTQAAFIPKEFKFGTEVVDTLGEGGSVDGVVLRNGSSYHFHRPSSAEATTVSKDGHEGSCGKPRKHRGRRRLKFADEQWDGCYKNDHKRRVLSIGVAMGSKLFSKFSSNEARALTWLSSMVAEAILVYEAQMNIELHIGTVYISQSNKRPAWDTQCKSGIQYQLTSFERFRKPANEAVWHVFDDCFRYGRGGNIIGLASMGTMCQPRWGFNTGANYYSYQTWLTFAHELGHNMNADHSFERGQGRTGGIMDYGNGKLNGKYQFTDYRKQEMCRTLARHVDKCEGKFVERNGLTLTTKVNDIPSKTPTQFPTRRPTTPFPTRKPRPTRQPTITPECSSFIRRRTCLGRRGRKYYCRWDRGAKTCGDRPRDKDMCYTKHTKGQCRRKRAIRRACKWTGVNTKCVSRNPVVAKTDP